MAIPAKPKKSLEPVATLRGTGATAAEAATATQALDATANDIECPNSIRGQLVFSRRALQAAASWATPRPAKKRCRQPPP